LKLTDKLHLWWYGSLDRRAPLVIIRPNCCHGLCWFSVSIGIPRLSSRISILRGIYLFIELRISLYSMYNKSAQRCIDN
jgi:hypothetical protein